MNFTGFFINRTVFTSLMAFSIFLAGIITFHLIPVSALPKLDFPAIQVKVNLPGATPEVMGRVVALPLERNFSTIPGIQSIVSTSTQGSTIVNLQFDLDRNIDAAAQDVGTAISAAQKTLPPDLPSPPTYKKVDPSEQPVLYLAVRSDILPLNKVNDYAQSIADRISILPSVAQVELLGSQQFAVRIYVDPGLAALRQLSLTDISDTINKANTHVPTGQLDGAFKTQIIKTDSELYNAREYENIILSSQNDRPLHVRDIGYSVNSVQNKRTAAWFNGVRCVLLAVSRQPGSNTINVVDSVLKALPDVTASLPPVISVDVIADRSQSIRDSVKDVEFTFILSIILVVAVIYLFLQNLKATLIPAITLPLSILMTFVFMYYSGYSINNLTLLALTLSVGFIVDDAIVVMENITHYVERGTDPFNAALKGSSEITFTIISMTLSLAAVFLPIIFLQGIVGRLFHEFGMTVSIVILMSGVIALTISPLMCRHLLKQKKKVKKKSSLTQWFQVFFDWLRRKYESSLMIVMKHRKMTLCGLGAILILNLRLFMIIPKGFFPNEDTGFIYGVTEANTDISFEAMSRTHHKVMDILRKNPDVDLFNASIGASTTTQSLNNGRFFVRLKPLGERKSSIEQVIGQLREQFADIPEIKVYMQSVQNLRVGGSLGKSQYVYTIQGPDVNELYPTAALMQDELSKIAGLTDIASDAAVNGSQILVSIDRDRAYTLRVSVEEINDALNLAFGDQQISLIYGNLNTYLVILNVPEEQSRTWGDLSSLFVKNSSGKLIRLDTLVRLKQEAVTLTVNHYNQLPSVTLSFNLLPGIALGNIVKEIRATEDKLFQGKDMYSIFQGAAQAYEESTKGEIWILLGAILAIYIILGMLYESYIHPITILSGIPTAGVGALLALYFTGLQLDAVSFIGIILLIGIMKKNAIMMVDYALQCKRTELLSAEPAILKAANRRFRPIMMTTIAAIVGTLPIALGLGASAELRRPMGVAIMGGLLLSQLLTLYITPVIFVWLDGFSRKVH